MLNAKIPSGIWIGEDGAPMAAFTMTKSLDMPYSAAVEAARAALSEQGFGILTEIDVAATLRDKLGVDVAPQIILGACRPPLAYQAMRVDPSIAAVLPCNVVVRAVSDETTVVEAFDPDAMMGLAANDDLVPVAAEARQRIAAALATLAQET